MIHRQSSPMAGQVGWRISKAGQTFYCLLLIAICVLIRAVLLFNYEPVTFSDTSGYEELALQIRDIDFTGYTGFRTPVYSLMLLLCGLDYQVIWYAQSALGIAVSLILFQITVYQTESMPLSFLVGLVHSLNFHQVLFEANILTETLSTFLLALSVLMMARIHYEGKDRVVSYALAAIVVSSLGLTRPLFLFLAPVYFLFLGHRFWSKKTGVPKGLLLSFAVPIIIIVGGWSLFMPSP